MNPQDIHTSLLVFIAGMVMFIGWDVKCIRKGRR